MFSPLEIATNYVDIGAKKGKMSATKTLLLGIFADMFIAFGGIASTAASATLEGSMAKVVSGLVFPAGLAMVLMAGSELFTGDNLVIIALLEKKIRFRDLMKNWVCVFFGNFIGAILVTLLVVYGHTPDMFGGKLAESMVSIASAKVSLTFTEAFIRGIGCNILVCIAVWASFASGGVAGKLLMSFWPVFLFVICGFEHSVANMYFCMAGIFTKMEYGIAAEGLTLGNFLVKNLLPVTLGNIVGGAVIVGFGYWFIYLKKNK